MNPHDLVNKVLKVTCGIYSITNNNTGSIYIGRAKDIQQRFITHCSVPPIDLALATEGVENFTLSVVEETPNDIDILKRKEKYWIKYYDVENNPKHYNVGSGNHDGRGKYNLWDSTKCSYQKNSMYQCNRTPDPCKCFIPIYNTYPIRMGLFSEPLSCEIINELIKDALNNSVGQ